MAKRLLLETDKRLLLKFLYLMGYKGMRAVRLHRRRLARGEFFPPFLHVSITNRCNLRCQGCWIDVTAKTARIEADAMNHLIGQAKRLGTTFFGILGGEPLLHPELPDILAAHPDCYFQVFTNGHFLTDEVARQFRRLGNVTPLVSIEGDEIVSDQRRGGRGVWSKSLAGLKRCVRNKLLTGVSTSLCRTNIDDLLTAAWLDRLIEMGVMYVWYYTYRPAGPNAHPELALSPEQQLRVRRFCVEMRVKKPIGIIDVYYDGRGRALCPTATGLAHHVGPWGDIEPCPVIQLATDSIYDDRPLLETFTSSAFLREYRELARRSTRGCILLERPELLRDLAEKHGARDTTARQTVLEELRACSRLPSQYDPEHEIPEKSWAYRLAKRFCFGNGQADAPRP